MRRARAGDLGRVLHRLHQRDRVGAARRPCRRRCVTRRASASAAVAWSSRTRLLPCAERGEVAREVAPARARRRALRGAWRTSFDELAAVDDRARAGPRAARWRRRAAAACARRRAPRMLKVQATRVRVGDDQRVGAQLRELRADARELVRRRLRRRSAGRAARPAPSGGAGRSVQIASIGLALDRRPASRRPRRRPWRAARRRRRCAATGRSRARSPAGEVRLDPVVGRRLDQVLDGEQRGVDLLARLQRVAAVDEQHGARRSARSRCRPSR